MRISLNAKVGSKIRELRKQAGITQQDWERRAREKAEPLGLGPVVSWQQHAKKERGQQAFTLDEVELAGEILGVPVAAIIGDDAAPPAQTPSLGLADLTPDEAAMIHTWRAAGRKAAALYLIAPLKD